MASAGRSSAGFVAVEADFEGVARARRSAPAVAAEAEGLVLDVTIFVVRAAIEALAEFPRLNATLSPAGVELQASRNVGVSIDLAQRMLVPVIAGAQDLNLRGLARRLGELKARARSGELAVEDLLNGTFTVVDAPSDRVLLSFPQLVEPQVAVLSLGGVARRAAVLSEPGAGDSIAIRSIGVLGLGYDSRAVDDTTAARFLERVAELLATQDWAAEL
jgi:2-oxoglutarate dehydrogenase E2 component (dihydrolipoamide succinyltransferase)